MAIRVNAQELVAHMRVLSKQHRKKADNAAAKFEYALALAEKSMSSACSYVANKIESEWGK
jgi:hypothetical protein